MKISPVIDAGSRNPGLDQPTISPERLERAKAIAAGEVPQETQKSSGDAQVDRIENKKRLKLKTQVTPDRPLDVVQETPQVVEQANQLPNDTLTTTEQTDQVSEATKPVSPQLAALAREKRELQLLRKQIEAEKAALGSQTNTQKALEDYRSRLKSNALSVLLEEGVTYDQLTEQILAQNQGSQELSQLKMEIKALKEGLETQNKSLTEREAQTEQQALSQMKRDTERLVAQGDDYEMIREAGYAEKVVELIHKTWKDTGELLEIQEAANLIEKELLEESLRFAKIKKVQSQLTQAQQQQAVQQNRSGAKPMKTLTNRDGSSPVALDRRTRAILAMEGRLK